MRPSRTALLTIATLALGVGACGGGDGDDKLAKADLAKQASAICKEFDEKIKAVPQPTGARDPGSAAAYYEKTRPLIEGSIAELEKLEPDDAVQQDWKTFIDKQNEAARLLSTLLTQIKARDAAAQQTLAQINEAVADGSAAVRRIGADGCASAPASSSS